MMFGRRDTGGCAAGKSDRGCKENRSETTMVVEGTEARRTLIINPESGTCTINPSRLERKERSKERKRGEGGKAASPV
jgi:hypothetical protein